MSNIPAPPAVLSLTSDIWRERRAKLAKKIHTGIAIVFAAKKTGSNAIAYRPNPNLWYLSGCTEMESALVIVANSGKIESETLYCRERNKVTERWDGNILGPARAKNQLGIDKTKQWKGERDLLASVLPGQTQVFMEFSCGADTIGECVKHMELSGARNRACLHDLRASLGQLRMVKEKREISAIKVAAYHTMQAYLAACEALPKARWEREIAAQISKVYRQAGGTHAFQPIVACAANACVAHYVSNHCKLHSGKLLLIDTGCEINGYTADMTRVMPVSGKFSAAQRDLHDIVVAAEEKAIGKVKPGNTLTDANKAASLELARGLIHLGVCRGTAAKVMASKTFTQYYFHSIGHSLGMDVHDSYIKTDTDAHPALRANMVVTIEPGLYFDDAKKVPRELRNTGIRIEDTLAVTSKGSENLTLQAPKNARSVEKLLQK